MARARKPTTVPNQPTEEVRTCIKRLERGTRTSQSGNHDASHDQVDKGLTAGVSPLKIASVLSAGVGDEQVVRLALEHGG